MSLFKKQEQMSSFNNKINKYKDGMYSLEEMSTFLEDPELDNETKVYFSNIIIASLPDLLARFEKLQIALGLVQPPTEPQP
jgi:hypothetical protein